jgi:hypothetical protein
MKLTDILNKQYFTVRITVRILMTRVTDPYSSLTEVIGNENAAPLRIRCRSHAVSVGAGAGAVERSETIDPYGRRT